jgi:hypothetical protein
LIVEREAETITYLDVDKCSLVAQQNSRRRATFTPRCIISYPYHIILVHLALIFVVELSEEFIKKEITPTCKFIITPPGPTDFIVRPGAEFL